MHNRRFTERRSERGLMKVRFGFSDDPLCTKLSLCAKQQNFGARAYELTSCFIFFAFLMGKGSSRDERTVRVEDGLLPVVIRWVAVDLPKRVSKYMQGDGVETNACHNRWRGWRKSKGGYYCEVEAVDLWPRARWMCGRRYDNDDDDDDDEGSVSTIQISKWRRRCGEAAPKW